MSKLVDDQKAFYAEKFRQFGDDPRSLSYNSAPTQNLRFKILAEVLKFETGAAFSLHEVGCGLAHLNAYLLESGVECEYSGSDICPEFIETARQKYPDCRFVLQDMSADSSRIPAEIKGKDYYVQSGSFNPIGKTPTGEWEDLVYGIISNMFQMCNKGIAFNFLTAYSDADCRSSELYYADPRVVFDWCKKHLSRFVSVIEDRPVYEFTVLVFKKDFVRSLYSEEFARYFRR